MQTRSEARAQPFTRYDETGLQELLNAYDARMKRLNDQYLRMMGEHIAEIGTMIPSDVHRLQQIRRMNKNLSAIERRIAAAAGMSVKDIRQIFEQAAQEDVRMAQKILGVPDTVRVSDNLPLQRILQAQVRETAGRMQNLSNTTVVSKPYRNAVDASVSAVQSGVEDYGSAIRRTIREAGQMGLRVRDEGTTAVDYESGNSRRLDSAVRMNILDGVRHLNQSIMEEVGREFGADGVEIDAHMLCAEDHLPYQGTQMTNEVFEQLQDSLPRPFGEWNCRHSWHPILLGISQPTYTPAQLQEMHDYSTEEIEIDGRTKTRYEWSQEMRRAEVAIRQTKDVATLAVAAGDDTLQRQCQGKIVALNEHYRTLAGKAGLKPEYQRTYVAGFRDAGLTRSENNGRITVDDSKYIGLGDAVRRIIGAETKVSESTEGESKVSSIRTFTGLSHYMQSQYGVSVDPSVRGLRFTDVRQGIAGLDEIFRMYPEAAEMISRITTCSRGVMSATSDSIGFNPLYFSKGKGEAAKLESIIDGQSGENWIRNASVRSLGYHEGGHLIEGLLTRIHSSSRSPLHWNDEWNRGVQAERIMRQACENLRTTEYGSVRNYRAMRRDISRYALKSASETLAEAIADSFRNGESASPLSKEIRRIIDDEINAYREGQKR